MKQIYKSKHFGVIDLGKIILITDPKREGEGGLYVGFEMFVQLRDSPLTFRRRLEVGTEQKWIEKVDGDPYWLETGNDGQHTLYTEAVDGYWAIRNDVGEWKRNIKINIDNDYTVAEENLQAEINELVNAWESYCTAYAVSHFPRPAIATPGPNSY